MKTASPMLTLQEALDALLAPVHAIPEVDMVNTVNAHGRVLAADLSSTMDVPGVDNSQMDGYALRTSDAEAGKVLPVSQRIAAGHVGTALTPGTAARIFTGAPVPAGADAIVMQEQCESLDDGKSVKLLQVPRVGDWVRRAGEDIRRDSVILSAGTRLRAQHCGLAASVGAAQIPVRRRLKVAVFFTGDELVTPGQPLPAGSVYNSNRYLISALLENYGCEVGDFGIVPDNLAATRAALRSAAGGHDLIVTSGGVSVGEEDHVKPAVEAEGLLKLWQIAIKPGKPLAFGAVADCWFIGLPGNPVSSFVTFLLLVRPFLLRLQGVVDVTPKSYPMRADFNWAKPDRRNEFLRARLNSHGGLDLFANQGSAVLNSVVWGDGLIDNPAGQAIASGDLVRFIPFSELMS